VIGSLEVASRLGDVAHFGSADVACGDAGRTRVGGVENARLVERLRFDAYTTR